LFHRRYEACPVDRKNRPEWQAGRLNGIGGHVEGDPHWPSTIETADAAMVREFHEETGVQAKPEDWKYLTLLRGPNWVVHCFYAINSDYVMSAVSTTDETVGVYPTCLDFLREEAISNVPWLVGLAMDPDQPRIRSQFDYATQPEPADMAVRMAEIYRLMGDGFGIPAHILKDLSIKTVSQSKENK
jgi:8-oxo-dGTP diphosphatase